MFGNNSFLSEKANDDEVFDFFKEDVTFDSAVKVELQLWRTYFHDHVELPDTPQSSLKYASPLLFPNIRKMLIHVMVLPVTSCEAERLFSAL